MRSSTVKVHMKTHGDNTTATVIKVKNEMPLNLPNRLEEEKKFAPPVRGIEERKMNQMSSKPIMRDGMVKIPENRVIRPKPIPYTMNGFQHPQDIGSNRVDFNKLKFHDSISATITSSIDNVFDNPRAHGVFPIKKKVPLMVPSLNGLGRVES
mmetsp:Transcript_5020/g.5717  ORF Transcript_5020/g.5717 Transcript_5020/m.5717 type:complete len:153 (-) Transcript_5020:98-556(-)